MQFKQEAQRHDHDERRNDALSPTKKSNDAGEIIVTSPRVSAWRLLSRVFLLFVAAHFSRVYEATLSGSSEPRPQKRFPYYANTNALPAPTGCASSNQQRFPFSLPSYSRCITPGRRFFACRFQYSLKIN
ncbi:hypothetical protein PUN28_004969 [Cardiocondyla obscurior]|uniref:Uncharacterized protein n=1 Tax=Cardiocondyla obscurior TaxID=286306 RepID=A0AAW2GF74_9HYME